MGLTRIDAGVRAYRRSFLRVETGIQIQCAFMGGIWHTAFMTAGGIKLYGQDGSEVDDAGTAEAIAMAMLASRDRLMTSCSPRILPDWSAAVRRKVDELMHGDLDEVVVCGVAPVGVSVRYDARRGNVEVSDGGASHIGMRRGSTCMGDRVVSFIEREVMGRTCNAKDADAAQGSRDPS